MQKLFPLLLLALAPLPSLAQHEGGIWLGTAFEKKLNKKWSAELELGSRIEENFAQPNRWDAGLTIEHKCSKAFKLSAGYVFLHDRRAEEAKPNYKKSGVQNGFNIDEAFWRQRHRFHFTMAYKFALTPRLSLQIRERYQFTHNMGTTTFERKLRPAQPGYMGDMETYASNLYSVTREEETKRASDKHYLRTRLALEYNLPKSPLTPFVTYEMVNNIGENFGIERHRATIGTEWKLTKQHSFSAAYVFQKGESENGNSGYLHVAEVGYHFKF